MAVKSTRNAHNLKRAASWEKIIEAREALLTPYLHLKAGCAKAWGQLRKADRRRPFHHNQPRPTSPTTPPQSPELHPGRFAAGGLGFAFLIFLAAAYPFLLPHLYLAFAAVALPWRFYDFSFRSPRNSFFLLDFCYFVNLATIAFLLLPPALQDPRAEAAIYALSDGPVAFALVAWQCAWVFSSFDHTVSVLIHLMPGLAMYAHHHLPRVATLRQILRCASMLRHPTTALHFGVCCIEGDGAQTAQQAAMLGDGSYAAAAVWLMAAPLAFYSVWQLMYWFLVQVVFRQRICRDKMDTSYRCLARRASRAGSPLSRLILRGSTGRRVAMYGALQLAFTVGTLAAFVPTFYSWHAAFIWQVFKFALPVYYGAIHLCQRAVKAAISDAVRRRQEESGKGEVDQPPPTHQRPRQRTSDKLPAQAAVAY